MAVIYGWFWRLLSSITQLFSSLINQLHVKYIQEYRPSWSWLYGSWINNYMRKLWVLTPLMTRCTISCDKVCQWLAIGLCFSLSMPVSSTNNTDGKRPLLYNWNIVESGIKHHKSNQLYNNKHTWSNFPIYI